MRSAPIAGIVTDPSAEADARRLEELCDFFGIAWKTFPTSATANPGEFETILAPLTAAQWVRDSGLAARTCFFYATNDIAGSSRGLQVLNGAGDTLVPSEKNIVATVSPEWSDLTGPMRGLRVGLEAGPNDFVVARTATAASNIIRTRQGAAFFRVNHGRMPAFVSCSAAIPDLDEVISGRGYDVRKRFLSAVPLVMYLKWAFRDTCWQPHETAACFIIDDPVLKTRYGFCDFRLLDEQMKRHSFSTSIAVIPWNSRRTSVEMASLINKSTGRLSVSVHGCDHTAREFGSKDAVELDSRVRAARERMEEHRKTTEIEHDAVMVFPQGIFSRQSLSSLQTGQFVAAANTESLPFEREGERLTVRDVWSVAINRYGSFPLFTRRYPSDGIENFAFDSLLGKPCLVVEHHSFFKNDHREAVRFVDALNALNVSLHWRSLGGVVRRSYLSRPAGNGTVQVRMFGNELLLRNDGTEECEYHVEKADEGSAGVSEVLADGRSAEWESDGRSVRFKCLVAVGAETTIQVRYTPARLNGEANGHLDSFVKVAARRYLSEFRDNVLSRHKSLLAVAQKAKRLTSRSRRS